MGTRMKNVRRMMLIVAAMLAGLFGLAAASASAQADPVSNPGNLEAAVTSGNFDAGALQLDLADFSPNPITASVAADGTVAVAQSDLSFADAVPMTVTVGGNPVDVELSLAAAGAGTGTVDPDAGTLSLDIPLTMTVTGVSTSIGPNCASGPINLTLTSSDYDQETGQALLSDLDFTVPAVTGCDKIGGVIDFAGPFNTEAGLPSTTGNGFTMGVDFGGDAPLGPLAARFDVDPAGGVAPLEVSFDASASSSRITEYEWDFGDGTPTVTETDPNTTHTYADLGSYTPSLTVKRADATTDTLAAAAPIEVTGATASIDAKPPVLSNISDPEFSFSSDLTPATFECSLDSDPFAACDADAQFPGLADGTHTLSVRAVHQGVAGLATAPYEFEIYTVKPVASIDSAPDALYGPGTTEFTIDFSGDKGALDFECNYDGAGFAPCNAPYEVSWAEADGNHNFKVRAIDELGNVGDPAVANWEVDVTAPTTTIDSSPVSPNGFYDDSRAGFEFSSNEPASFVCQFNGAAERPCDTGVQAGSGDQGGQDRLGMPSEGTNNFKVWAIDAAGNRDATGATASYQFIGEQPEISMFSGPDEYTTVLNANIVFQSDNQDVTKFECRDLFAGNAWSDCTPGKINARTGQWVASNLAEGQHTLEVRGVNSIGTESKGANVGTYVWNIDLTAPTVQITDGPQEGVYTNSDSATLEFGASEDGVAFECKINGGAWSACSTPLELTNLAAGNHSVEIRGTDPAGHLSTNTDTRTWHVGTSDVTISDKPAALSPSASASFDFASTPAAGQYECRLDPSASDNANDAGWSNCATGKSYSGLSDGSHEFQVRGDGGFPAMYTWTVATQGPVVDITGAPEGFSGLDQDSATIGFTAEDPHGPVTQFDCRYQQVGSPVQPWDAGCTAPQQVSWDPQDNGKTMQFEVRATSPAGVVGPVSTAQWEIINSVPAVSFGPDVAGWDGTTNTGGFDTADSDVPALVTTVTEPQFRFNSTATQGVTGPNFACQLNGGAVIHPCGADGVAGKVIIAETGPDALGQAAVEGENTLTVWAVDGGGNTSANPVSYSWTQDTTAPTVTYTSSNPLVTNGDDLAITFTADQDVRTAPSGWKCRFDGAPGDDDPENWVDCSTLVDPITGAWVGAPLVKGQHTFDVKAIDPYNNRIVTGNGERYKFTIDRNVPQSQITSAPTGTVPEDTATIEFDGTGKNGIDHFECQLDGNGWSVCSSPRNLTGLGNATHTFEVRAHDKAGNVEDTPSSATWTVDSTVPVVNLSNNLVLIGGKTKSTSAEFTYTVNPADADVSCRLIGPGQTDQTVTWAACSTPKSYSNLVDGAYEFQIKAANDLGTESNVIKRNWTIDTVAPVVTVGAAPSGTTNSTSASVAFTTDKPGSIVGCQLDSGAVTSPCSSPVEYTGLADGAHTVTLTVVDPLGNTGTAKTANWTVDTVAPVTSIGSAPSGETIATDATLEFSADKAGSTFECQLDSGAWATCTSPKSYTGLALGSHTVNIRATDTVGNAGTAVSASWTVVEPPPTTCPDGQLGTPPDCRVPTAAKLKLLSVKAPKKVKSGKKLTVTVRVKNLGESPALKTRVCVKAAKRLVKGKANVCSKAATLAAGAARTIKVKIKTKPRKKGKKLRLKINASATGTKTPNRGHVTLLK